MFSKIVDFYNNYLNA